MTLALPLDTGRCDSGDILASFTAPSPPPPPPHREICASTCITSGLCDLERLRVGLELAMLFLRRKLPQGIVYRILGCWTGAQRLCAEKGKGGGFDAVRYVCDTDTVGLELPGRLGEEYLRYQCRSFLYDDKYFDDPGTFYISHFLLTSGNGYNTPKDSNEWIQRVNQRIPMELDLVVRSAKESCSSHLHGLEKITLDFTAGQYFALFNVGLPPFDHIADHDVALDPLLHGAASFLASTKHLTLHFGTAYKSLLHPWHNLSLDTRWTANKYQDYGEARLRPNICDSGLVVDWILEYAWEGWYLQHIPRIRITGAVQHWVQKKWHAIFEKQAAFNESHSELEKAARNFAVYDSDVDGIELMDVDKEEGTACGGDKEDGACPANPGYAAEDYFPPVCRCSIACWKLGEEKEEEEEEEGEEGKEEG